jgi:hypothetical protein
MSALEADKLKLEGKQMSENRFKEGSSAAVIRNSIKGPRKGRTWTVEQRKEKSDEMRAHSAAKKAAQAAMTAHNSQAGTTTQAVSLDPLVAATLMLNLSGAPVETVTVETGSTGQPAKSAKNASKTVSFEPTGSASSVDVPQQAEAKPISPAKLKANRENSKRSTGPRTEEGKKRSSQNSYKDGFFARRLFPSSKQWAEDGKDYQAIAAAVHEQYQPVGPWEMFWAEKIVTEALRNARSIGHQQSVLGLTSRFLGTQLNTAQRHESAAFKQMLRAIEMLESIQAARKAKSGRVQLVASDREQVSEASNAPEGGRADETKPRADSFGSEDTVEVSRADDEQDSNGFLYEGPADQDTVSSDKRDPAERSKVCGTNPIISDYLARKAAVGKESNVFQHIIDREIARDRGQASEPLASRTQAKDVGTKADSVPSEETTQMGTTRAGFKKGSE